MTKETINLLRNLIEEKNSRLDAIGRKLAYLRKLTLEAKTHEELDIISHEVKDLGAEIESLVASRSALQGEINDFYRPAA